MKKFTLLLTLLLSIPAAFSQTNLSDDLDANKVQAEEEERANELIESPDAIDLNDTPSALEEREEQEQFESDAIQTDDAEKRYDVLDEEADE
jgi:hypothetical protein